jgi:SAM-dependent methyltransferase
MCEHDICAVCANSKGNMTHVAREMMFGFRDQFEYLECGQCGCLQLKNVPADLPDYYPPDYYSLSETVPPSVGWIGMTLRRARSELILHETPGLARLVSGHRPEPAWVPWLRGRVTTRSRILDLGCGAGHFLLELRKQGFRNLTGVDAFIARTIRYANGVTIYKSRVEDVRGTFDLVMLHHSFEHMPRPLDVLKRISQLLRPGGAVLLRTPLADSFAWRRYGTNWVQLDAPRHLFLHTKMSMALLASRSGFATTEIRYDSSAFQFWGSEQYARDIPLRSPSSYAENPAASIFLPTEIADFERQARELNEAAEGDQAGFFLRRPKASRHG